MYKYGHICTNETAKTIENTFEEDPIPIRSLLSIITTVE